MPTRVLLEGPAIEPLLAQVREEYGPTARIISADKVRRGGLGGFFAREHYELSVEIDAPVEGAAAPPAGTAAPAAAAPAAAAEPMDLLALVESRQDALGAPEPTVPAPATARGRRRAARAAAALTAGPHGDTAAAPAAPPPGFTATLTGTPGSGDPLADIAPEPAAAPTVPLVRGNLVSTVNPGFAEVLAGLRGGLRAPVPPDSDFTDSDFTGPAATPAGIPAAQTIPAGTTPAGAAADPEGGVSAAAHAAHADTPPVRSAGDAEEADSPHLANAGPMYGPLAGQRRRAETPGGPAAEGGAGTRWLPPSADAPQPAEPDGAEDPDAPAAGPPAAEAHAAPEPEPAAAGGPHTAALIALGVPDELAVRADDADVYQAALQALATLPPAPPLPTLPGDVLVLAGELAATLPIAERVVDQLRIGRNALFVVTESLAGTGLHSSRRLADAADAARKAVTLRGIDHPHVVVADVPLHGRPAGWVDDLCTALDASDLWGVVDATRKTADSAGHLNGMGEIDALALYGLSATADPASALHLNVPVALLDGLPASAHAWAALLAARLGAAPLPSRRRRRRAAHRERP
ncbi:hypothetical protein GCM10010124_08220 [Pilimelia terevasa]|uniref:Uncharacterized protein n=1 Tax=Pilimelia terevasa TaxID=53372 RepID=A0A8J3FGP8_9ACTN|nr:hypothetical protein [Pilimelia terevasa]GGK18020.1 hypothetical protein GCM10010124_08220 [Pilimelia terevasa]